MMFELLKLVYDHILRPCVLQESTYFSFKKHPWWPLGVKSSIWPSWLKCLPPVTRSLSPWEAIGGPSYHDLNSWINLRIRYRLSISHSSHGHELCTWPYNETPHPLRELRYFAFKKRPGDLWGLRITFDQVGSNFSPRLLGACRPQEVVGGPY